MSDVRVVSGAPLLTRYNKHSSEVALKVTFVGVLYHKNLLVFSTFLCSVSQKVFCVYSSKGKSTGFLGCSLGMESTGFLSCTLGGELTGFLVIFSPRESTGFSKGTVDPIWASRAFCISKQKGIFKETK